MTNPEPSHTSAPSSPLIARGPGTLKSIQLATRFLVNPFGVLDELGRDYEPIVRFHFGDKRVLHLIHHPDYAEHVMLKNNKNYTKCTPYGLLKVIFGRGLLFNEGESWFGQRRLMQRTFHPNQHALMHAGIAETISAQMAQWRSRPDGQKIDMESEMSALARKMMGRLLFGEQVPQEVNFILDSEANKFNFLLANVQGSPQNLYMRYLVKRLDKVLYRIIKERRAGADADSPDMLNGMLNTIDKDTGEGMPDVQLRDEIVTLLFAGFDTTARTMTWAFHLLGQNPAIETRLHEELHETLAGRTPNYEDVGKLGYTAMCIHETMRIYPPNPVVGRQAKADDVIGGYRIPAGSTVTVSQYLAQRNPEFWERPMVFDPERFSPANQEKRHRFAHFPFGGGPRQCIGKGLALMTTTTAIAMIAREYQFCAVPNQSVKYDLKVTYQSRNGIPATRHNRVVTNAVL